MVGKKVKVVYKDGNLEKVARGTLQEEDAYTFRVLGFDGKLRLVGKAFVISVVPLEDEQ